MIMELLISFFLITIGIVAGGLNAVAGGGTFFAFPALLFLGAPSVAANATCTIAVWPASLASVYAFRRHMGEHIRRLPWVLVLAIIGGWVGAQLLLLTPDATFTWMIPWLLLIATLLFMYGKRMAVWVGKVSKHTHGRWVRLTIATALLLVTALYGGYFGAGLGILTLATLYALGISDDMHQLNAVKTVVAASVNASAFFTFVFSDIVLWHYALLMMVGGLMGGYFGARLSLSIAPEKVRRGVIAVAISMTVYFFFKTYG
jgi:uncharacterized protein